MKPSPAKYFLIAVTFGAIVVQNACAGQPLEFAVRGGLQHISEESIDNDNKLFWAGSVYGRVSEKSWIGIDIAYWQDGVNVLPDNVTSIYPYVLNVYRAGAGYKFALYTNNDVREPISMLIGGRLDYHRGYIQQDPNDYQLGRVQYDNLGMAMTAEARYSIFSFWGELAFARLDGGDTHGIPDKYWEPPVIDLFSAACGLGVVFRI